MRPRTHAHDPNTSCIGCESAYRQHSVGGVDAIELSKEMTPSTIGREPTNFVIELDIITMSSSIATTPCPKQNADLLGRKAFA